MRCIFIGHKYHGKTKSSQFFIELLSNNYEIDYYGVDPENILGSGIDRVNWGSYDLAVLWQLDFLYPIYSSKNIPFIVVPMYDATGGFGDVHFHLLTGALVICFSIELHMRCQACGVESIYWKYYPRILEPSTDFGNINQNEKKKVFFWIRNRNQISVDMLLKLFPPDAVDFVHVHAAMDDGSKLTEEESGILHHYRNLKITEWFESKEDYHSALSSCNIFLAPRIFEGIGMGFLEAMAYGLCVIAYDAPTHNEYIINYVNGVLFNGDHMSPVWLDSDSLGRIRYMARYSCKIGAENSVIFGCDLLEKISEYSRAKRTPKSIYKLNDNIVERIKEGGYIYYSRAVAFKAKMSDLIQEVQSIKPATPPSVRRANAYFLDKKYLEALDEIDLILGADSSYPASVSLLITALICVSKLGNNIEFLESAKFKSRYLLNIRDLLMRSDLGSDIKCVYATELTTLMVLFGFS